MRPRDELPDQLSSEAWDLIENCLERGTSPATSGADFLDPLFKELLDAGFVEHSGDKIQTEHGLTKVYWYTQKASDIRKKYYDIDTVHIKVRFGQNVPEAGHA